MRKFVSQDVFSPSILVIYVYGVYFGCMCLRLRVCYYPRDGHCAGFDSEFELRVLSHSQVTML